MSLKEHVQWFTSPSIWYAWFWTIRNSRDYILSQSLIEKSPNRPLATFSLQILIIHDSNIVLYRIFFPPRKKFLWIKEKFLWYTVNEKIYLNWRKFCWNKKIFFNVNKSIFLDQRKFFWNNKTFFNSKKFFLWPYIEEMFLWFKEIVFSVMICFNQINIFIWVVQNLLHLEKIFDWIKENYLFEWLSLI